MKTITIYFQQLRFKVHMFWIILIKKSCALAEHYINNNHEPSYDKSKILHIGNKNQKDYF